MPTQQDNLPGAKRYGETYGDAWVGIALAPGWRLVVAFVIGKRTQERADLWLARVAQVTEKHIPFFTSDQRPEYKNSWLHPYGQWYTPARRGRRGVPPKPRRRPPPGLRYAQVVKKREKGRVVAVGTQVVVGDPQAMAACLAVSPGSHTINTSFVERDNLTQRQSNRRLTRRTHSFSKAIPWFEQQLWLSLAYYHLILPHASLQEPLPRPESTRGTGSPRQWRRVTPALAAGMTDHVWATAELLSYRVPVAFLERLHEIEHLFPKLNPYHQGS